MNSSVEVEGLLRLKEGILRAADSLENNIIDLIKTTRYHFTVVERHFFYKDLSSVIEKHMTLLAKKHSNSPSTDSSADETPQIHPQGIPTNNAIGTTNSQDLGNKVKTDSDRVSGWHPIAKETIIFLVSFGLIRIGYQVIDHCLFKPLVTFEEDKIRIHPMACIQKIIEPALATLAVSTLKAAVLSKLSGQSINLRANILGISNLFSCLKYGSITAASLLLPEINSYCRGHINYIENYKKYCQI